MRQSWNPWLTPQAVEDCTDALSGLGKWLFFETQDSSGVAMGRFGFVVWMCAFGLLGWILFGVALWEYADFKWHAKAAVMTSSDPRLTKALNGKNADYMGFRLVYESPQEHLVVEEKYIRPQDVARLASGQGISIIYHTKNPRRVDYVGEPSHVPDGMWGGLMFGLFFSFLGFFSYRLYRSEEARKTQ